MSKPALPASGGSFTRQKDGSLERTAEKPPAKSSPAKPAKEGN